MLQKAIQEAQKQLDSKDDSINALKALTDKQFSKMEQIVKQKTEGVETLSNKLQVFNVNQIIESDAKIALTKEFEIDMAQKYDTIKSYMDKVISLEDLNKELEQQIKALNEKLIVQDKVAAEDKLLSDFKIAEIKNDTDLESKKSSSLLKIMHEKEKLNKILKKDMNDIKLQLKKQVKEPLSKKCDISVLKFLKKLKNNSPLRLLKRVLKQTIVI